MALPLPHADLTPAPLAITISDRISVGKYLGIDTPERHELFLLGDGEKKVTFVQETRMYLCLLGIQSR